ncbi:hypothetical protein [Streptomyces sp. OE57]|uniref:hypothetical protein n=1 Tax=Streptomyces lacaronensis TaxID=3379885 RepID=UPI0039B75033
MRVAQRTGQRRAAEPRPGGGRRRRRPLPHLPGGIAQRRHRLGVQRRRAPRRGQGLQGGGPDKDVRATPVGFVAASGAAVAASGTAASMAGPMSHARPGPRLAGVLTSSSAAAGSVR